MAEAFPLIQPLFLCYNLNVLLNMYRAMEPMEQSSVLPRIEDRSAWIASAVDQIVQKDDLTRFIRDAGPGYEYDDPNTYHFEIPSADGGKILARRSCLILSLPMMSPRKTDTSEWIMQWNVDIVRLQNVINAELGRNVYPLRPIWTRPDTRYGIEEVVLVLELLDDKLEAPDGLEWISFEDVLGSE